MRKPFPFWWRCSLLIAVTAMSLSALAAEPTMDAVAPIDPVATGTRLQVGLRVAPPFVIAEAGGYDGLAVRLWEDIARRNGWSFDYRAMPLEDLLDAVQAGQVDVAVGGLTVTADRERRFDFSQPFARGGLAIATTTDDAAALSRLFDSGLSWTLLAWMGGLCLLLALIGALAWAVERRANPEQFGGTPAEGLGNGFWWAVVTMTTVGYGDKAPVTVLGRALATLWMFAGLILVAVFTAAVTTSLTLGGLEGRVKAAGDLARVRVAAVAGSTGAEWLADREIAARLETDAESVVRLLAAGEVDAVVHDAVILQFLIQREPSPHLRVLSDRLDVQNYALALPEGWHDRREALNSALLEAVADARWQRELRAVLGGSG